MCSWVPFFYRPTLGIAWGTTWLRAAQSVLHAAPTAHLSRVAQSCLHRVWLTSPILERFAIIYEPHEKAEQAAGKRAWPGPVRPRPDRIVVVTRLTRMHLFFLLLDHLPGRPLEYGSMQPTASDPSVMQMVRSGWILLPQRQLMPAERAVWQWRRMAAHSTHWAPMGQAHALGIS